MSEQGKLANQAWEALLRAQVHLMRKFAEEDVWTPVSIREYDVLYTLSKQSGGMRLSELNSRVLLSQPALSRMVDRMESKGLLQRSPDPADGRSAMISLTREGHDLQREIGRKHAASVAEKMTATLAASQLAQLRDLCEALSAE